MTKKEVLEKTKEGLSKILKESFTLCDHSEIGVSSSSVSINKTAYKLKLILERFEKLEE